MKPLFCLTYKQGMSGGRFEYKQHHITDIAETIQAMIDRNGKLKEKNELYAWNDPDYYVKYPQEKYHHEYPPEVIDKLKTAVQKLKEAYVYTQRVDWLASGDDGEEQFLKRLKEDLGKI